MKATQGARLPASDRRIQLLEVARERFGEDGYTATSMNVIAEAAGVTKPVLYQHFESKRHLFRELLTETADELSERLHSALKSTTSGREKLERGIHEYVAFFDENPRNFRVLYGEGVRSDEEFRSILRELSESFHSFAATHIDIDELDQEGRMIAARAIAGQLEAAVEHWITNGRRLPAKQLSMILGSLAWRGLRGTSPTG